MAILKRPYEISVWEDLPEVTASGRKERKLAVIGSDKMTSPNKAFSPILTEKSNGEVTFAFSMAYKYFDPSIPGETTNPFIHFLINERKVKLHYDGKWYNFLIKTHSEDSENNIWTYELTDAYVNELSKVGYNVEFNAEINNNQGTIVELAEKTLEHTDWQVDIDNSDILQQSVKEPLYVCTLTKKSSDSPIPALTVTKLGDGNSISDKTVELLTSSNSETIYVFYSYFANRDKKYIQFIRKSEEDSFRYDDNGTIIADNYRIVDYSNILYSPASGFASRITIDNNYYIDITFNGDVHDAAHAIMLPNQGFKKVYKQLTAYDPVMEKTVNIYNIMNDGRLVYDFEESVYSTSDVIQSYVSNGNNFAVYDQSMAAVSINNKGTDDGYVQGWSKYTEVEKDGSTQQYKNQIVTVETRPKITNSNTLKQIAELTDIKGFLKLKFAGNKTSDNKNTIYNSGFENNMSFIDHINRGEEYVLRLAAGFENGNYVDPLENPNELGALIAEYVINSAGRREIINNGIIFDFNNQTYQVLNTTIQEGVFLEAGGHKYAYQIDGITQTPSTTCCYKTSNDSNVYVWKSNNSWTSGGITYHGEYVLKENISDESFKFYDYSYTTAAAKRSVSNEELTDPTKHIGIFLYTTNATKTYYISDIQITKLIKDSMGIPLTIGNIPTAHITTTHNYYIKPEVGSNPAAVETFASLEDLADDINCSASDIYPAYNESSQKILSITESQSNCFNILQTLCETFECWLKIKVDCDEEGYVIYVNGEPNKKISFHQYAGKDNFAGFKYGINLQSIQRNLTSDEIVTKLIVENSQSDYIESGVLSIRNAPTNPSGEANILNFDYYINKGLISNGELCRQQLNEYYQAMKDYNNRLNQKQEEKSKKEMSLLKLTSNVNIYDNLLNEAHEQQLLSLDKFEQLGQGTYDDYAATKTHTENLMDSDEVSAIVAEIYNSSVIINSYEALYTNIKKEYQNLKLEVEGAKDYNISVSVRNIEQGQYKIKVVFDDYIPGYTFSLYYDDIEKQQGATSFNQKVFEYTDTVPYNKFQINTTPIVSGQYYTNPCSSPTPLIIGTKSFISSVPADYKQQYPGLQAQIDKIQEDKDACEQEFYKKYSQYLKEGTWSSTDYVDPELYYFDALQVGHTSAFPKVEYTINVAEVSELDGLENYIFAAGDKSYIEDTEFFGWAAYYVNTQDGSSTRMVPDDLTNYKICKTPAREEVIISQVEWHLDEPEENVITVQNYKTQFEDLFQRISATVQTVQYNEATYAKTASILDSNGTINQSLMLASLNSIAGNTYLLTSDGSIVIDGDSITITDKSNPINQVRIDSRGISVTNDGNTWQTAIDGNGINAGLIHTGSINTDEVVIGNRNNPSFKWDKYGISAYKENTNSTERYDYRTYVRFDQYGLYGIENAANYKASSITDVEQTAQFGITWHGFFIKNSYPGGGMVTITHDNDFQILKPNEEERLKIGALEWKQENWQEGDPIYTDIKDIPAGLNVVASLYGIRIKNDEGIETFKTGDDGNIAITGEINATGGNFSELVTVGKNNDDNPYIAIDGRTSEIYSSNYANSAGAGWMINKDGDAVFNNITARGAIKTAVFEYAEIQAVGGVFLFRPTSTIKEARIGDESLEESEDDLILRVEKPLLFAKVTYIEIDNPDPEANPHDLNWYEKTNYGYQITDDTTVLDKQYYNRNEDTNGSWCKVSNYISDGVAIDSGTQNILLTNGLTHVYQVTAINMVTKEVTLSGAAVMVAGQNPVTTLAELEGGALIDMGRIDGSSNYGIGINSSDNTVNLPARAISLFETEIHPSDSLKVTYNYKGILGTLPVIENFEEDIPYEKQIYGNYMVGTQGIYTDNMYIGDKDQHVAFYTDDNGDKHLEIIGNELSLGAITAQGIVDIINTTDGIQINGDRLNLSQFAVIGDPNSYHIKVGNKTDDKTSPQGVWFFKDAESAPVAYLSSDRLYIPYSVVLNEMFVGSRENTDELSTDTTLWSWRKINAINTETGERGATHENLRLVWLGGDVD